MKTPVIFLAALLAGIVISCAPKTEAPVTVAEPTFVHTVFFWMSDSITADEKLVFEAALDTLATVPTVVKYQYGTPAGTPREVVDNTYGYAWITWFASTADYEVYETHPIHLAFIEKNKHLWKTVKVYDTKLIK